jgi:cadmium resistance protein CadD (predicted permease)
MWNSSAVALAVVVFASTNLDDLLVLSAFFAEPNAAWRTVVTGQFLGIGALVLTSVLIALAALRLPARGQPHPLQCALRRCNAGVDHRLDR